MIRISLGNIGSGKTANEVREMYLNKSHRRTYSNIKTTLSNQLNLKPEYIIHKKVVDTKKNKKTGEDTPIYELKLNVDYWKRIKEPINVVLDEAHSIINSRRAMSKPNIIMGDWIALIRRVLGSTDAGHGELVFITQLPNRIDNIARDMAHQIRYHVCHYQKRCLSCGYRWHENSELPEPLFNCPACNHANIHKHSHILQIWFFSDMEKFQMWRTFGANSFYKSMYVHDIEKYFPYYDTLQWDNLFSDYY